ncbi:MAG: winged helix-turn-helix transcriptional regulator [Parcubacteria group bacterium]|jgi:DNA-binding MarR family transcriptional regulator
MPNKKTPSPVEPIICLAHRLEAIANKYVFQPMGFSSVSMKILKALQLHSSLSPSDLITITSSTKSNISQRLNFLEKEGYLKRNSASVSSDQRKINIQLTRLGEKKLLEIEKRFNKARISFAQKLTAKEIEQHRLFIQKINTILDSEENELEKLFKN